MARELDCCRQLTVIVAAKGEQDVFDLVEHLKAQSVKPSLIISCTKNSVEKYQMLKSDKIQVVVEEHSSIGGAWQSAIKKTQTSHCVFFGSSDRFYESETVEKVLYKMGQHPIKNCFFGAVQQLRTNGTSFLSREYFDSKRFYTTGNALCHQGVIFSVEILKSISFSSLRTFCDYEMSYKSFQKSEPVYLDHTIAIMTKDGLSTSWQYRLRMRREFNEIIRENNHKPSNRAKVDYVVSIILYWVSKMVPVSITKRLAYFMVGRFQ